MKKIFFRPFCCHFFSVYSFNALQSDNNSNRVYVLGHKYKIILGPSQSSFKPSPNGSAKMSLSQAQNMFMPANINSIVLLINFENVLKG